MSDKIQVRYRYLVEMTRSKTRPKHVRAYDGTNAADAMAEWSRLVSEGHEYVMLEALRDRQCEDGRECVNHCGGGPCSHRCQVCQRLAFTDTTPCPACIDHGVRAQEDHSLGTGTVVKLTCVKINEKLSLMSDTSGELPAMMDEDSR